MGGEQVVVRLTMKQAGMIAASLSLIVLAVAYLTESKLAIIMSLTNLLVTILLTRALIKG